VIRFVLGVLGALLLAAGTVFALQGFGVLGGSFMSNNNVWAAAGPIIALVGLALLVGAARRGRPRSSAHR
jgi:hypothetical protein